MLLHVRCTASVHAVHQSSDETRIALPTSNARCDRKPSLGPAALGLYPSFRRGPCIGPNCPACLTGVKHPGSVLYGREKGRRFSAYVPEELVPQVQRWLDQLLSGRANERVVSALGRRVVRSHF